MKKVLLGTLALLLVPFAAQGEELCYVPYEEFELAVPHVDTMVCPQGGLSISDYFCRIAIDGETLTLYTFQFVGDNACLFDAEEMSFAEFREKYGISYEYE